jgi:hypothetical protein
MRRLLATLPIPADNDPVATLQRRFLAVLRPKLLNTHAPIACRPAIGLPDTIMELCLRSLNASQPLNASVVVTAEIQPSTVSATSLKVF